MIHSFPTDRKKMRETLLDAVEAVREVLVAGAAESEEIGTLPEASVDALEQAGLLAMKLPAEFGGAEADPVTQLQVIEAVTRIDPSAGWVMMIGAATIASPAVFLSDEAIEQMFIGGRPPRTAGALMPSGQAMPVDGGYVVNGRWSFGSGIKHSQWISAGALVTSSEGEILERLSVVFPTAEAMIHDNWQVGGLKGTGSNDFSVSGLFVPDMFTWRRGSDQKPRRGGPLYRIGLPGFLAVEHAAFALGVGHRALEAIIDLAQNKKRGYSTYSNPALLADRSSFQLALGRHDLRLRAARSLATAIFEGVWETVCRGGPPTTNEQADMRACGAFATEVAADVVTNAFRYGGGTALYSSHILQRCLSDINAAAQHFMVNDTAYESHGQLLLGLPDANPMS
ncbi:MAG TPA: hypothetical protein EYM38_01490 [Dehalococcoidia bacterium]|nr:hypothetical protein [Dehalococcoidia bacterium]